MPLSSLPDPPSVVVIFAALAGLLTSRLNRLGPPSRNVNSSGFGPWLAAYSCGGSAGFSPVSLFADESPREHQSYSILCQGRVGCQYLDVAAGAIFFIMTEKGDCHVMIAQSGQAVLDPARQGRGESPVQGLLHENAQARP